MRDNLYRNGFPHELDVTDNDATPDPMDFTHPDAAKKLWETFYHRLCLAVRQRVRNIRRPVASESEVALSAINSFFNRARDGQFPDLADEEELWRLLKTIAIRKTNDLRKHLRAQKRGGNHVVYNQSDLDDEDAPLAGVDAASGREITPALEAELSDLMQVLLERLPDDRHRDVILLKLQGASVPTIAEHLSTTTRTVQRMIKKIEAEWQSDLFDTQ
ncbi:ECF-type sigma factor [Stieleria varia]|nr:ECF-type sigma factor [Stieleria varia]